VLIVALSAFALNVLLNSIDLRFVLDQLLLDVVQPVVDFTLQDLVLLGVMLHVVVGNLLGQPVLVNLQELFDLAHSDLLVFELTLQVLSLGELVLHLILHCLDLFLGLLHFLVDSSLQILDLVQIALDLFLLNSQSCCCVLCVLKLSLLKLKISPHVFDLLLGRQLVLSSHSLLHVLEELGDDMLVFLDFFLILYLFGLELLSELVNLFLFLIEDLILLLFS